MLHFFISLSFVATTFGKPLDTCSEQAKCLDLNVQEQEELDSNGNKQYEICLFYDPNLENCGKEENQVSHACAVGSDLVADEKIEGFASGLENAMCDIVSCDGFINFGIKDGSSCDAQQDLFADFGIDNYDEMAFCYDGFDCSGKNKTKNAKACRWSIPAPKCNEECANSDRRRLYGDNNDPNDGGVVPSCIAVCHRCKNNLTPESCEDLVYLIEQNTGHDCRYCLDVLGECGTECDFVGESECSARTEECEEDGCCVFDPAGEACYPIAPFASSNLYFRERVTADNNYITNDGTQMFKVYAVIIAILMTYYVV